MGGGGRSRRVWFLLLSGGLLLIGYLLIHSRSITISQPCEISLSTPSGDPLKGVRIRQTWAFYGIDDGDEEEYRRTNGDGIVRFPMRTTEASGAAILSGWINSFLNVHSSYGPSCRFYCQGVKGAKSRRIATDDPRWVDLNNGRTIRVIFPEQ